MRTKNCFLLFLVIALILSFSGCKRKSGTKEYATSVFNNDQFPSFVVENISASSGEKDVVVFVKLKDNPGFLTMAMNIEYDSSALALTDVKNGSGYKEYNFIGPKNRSNGCTASWFISELPEKIVDGILLELHFSVLSNAKSGDYQIKILRPDNGGIVDGNKETLVINNAVGYITIK